MPNCVCMKNRVDWRSKREARSGRHDDDDDDSTLLSRMRSCQFSIFLQVQIIVVFDCILRYYLQ